MSAPTTGSATDPLWYKEAIIYELHVRTFFDSNGDGIGDFRGLIAKLDYLERLGVTCLWLLPFYESPLRDDGYDIAHYERINPSYGGLDDFKQFLAAAHARGFQLITELVINHTSDQHPWFQAARLAPPGSPKRDFYVWSENDTRFAGASIIFRDVEASNWTWDAAAAAYYWHRFYHHQPDLNFDNPHVKTAVLKVMRFWLEMGVDGLRLDAVAHLFEREGTSCDNLPETHAFLKQIRADMDCRFENRVLLAEANQWPADARPYFGDGDECHMAFHFPLMPRLFMALKREEAFPIVEIIQQTNDLPATCQWAVFLRNHDELTLSAVTDEERDFMYGAYAAEPRMRLNHGIRRRLAPLLANNRGALRLAHALLLSLPGTPVLYYGDEIGMGDNTALGDRDGVRTPMQWSAARHGGFSQADPPLASPPIVDVLFGYERINVESQEQNPDSLLTWITRLIHIRRRHSAFGRGDIRFLDSGHPSILAFMRLRAGQTILVIANLSSSSQVASIQLPESAIGLSVTEIIADKIFPAVDREPYRLRMAAHTCRWLCLSDAAEVVPSGGRQ